jgi:quinol monooxygenase YgiN
MYARNVSIHLKSNTLSDYTRTFENDVLPLLRKQNGFKDEITFSNPSGNDVTVISLWDNKANADAYNTNTYQQVTKLLAKVLDGTPKVQSGEVVNSTFHKIHAAEHVGV